MPNGFWYASGGRTTDERIPGSAFSKGDLLALDSSSSLSRIAETHGQDIYGVALADSNDSINDLVPVLVPEDDTHFWSRISDVLTSELTTGVEADILFDTGVGRYYVEPGSTNTARSVTVRGTDDIDQSVQSKALVKLIFNAGDLELS